MSAERRKFADAFNLWKERVLLTRKDQGSDTIRSFKKDVLPELDGIALPEISKSIIVDILDKIVARGSRSMANHVFADLRQFFNYAVDREWIAQNPIRGLNKNRIGGADTERERNLSDQEILELKRKLPEANLSKTTEIAVWLMLGTCCRVGELLKAKWEDVDLHNLLWRIPVENSKNGKAHVIYLSEFALKKFHALQSLTGETNWCFPSADTNNPVDSKTITKQIRDRMRLKALRGRTKALGTLVLAQGNWITPGALQKRWAN